MEKAKFCRIIFFLSFFFCFLFTETGQAATETGQQTPAIDDSNQYIGLPPSGTPAIQGTKDSSTASPGTFGLDSYGSPSSATSSILFTPVIQPNGNTGASTTSIPIEVPPGRKVQPNLALTYNSNTKDGLIGVGWSLPTAFIQRNTKYGVNYNSNDFVHVSNDSKELVARGDWGANFYGEKIEGSFSKYYYSSSTGWEVTGKDGTKYFYGSTLASRQDNANGIFKWMLDKVQDTNGNYIAVSYWKDQGEIYVSRMDYTGNTGLSPTNYVNFTWETRTDSALKYTSNSSVVTRYRLKTIEAYANTQLVRKYVLNYSSSTSTYRSMLTSVIRYGTDGVTTLPTISLGYQDGGDGKYNYNSNYGPGAFGMYNFYPADVTGDGKTDVIAHNPTEGYVNTLVSNGDGTYVSYNNYGPGVFTNYKFYAVDVTGDGKSDIVAHNSTDGYVHTLVSNGNGTYNSYPNYGPGVFTGYNFYPADVTGDGKTDIVAHNPTSGYVHTLVSNGDGTYASYPNYGPGVLTGYTFYVADVNGDGKSDIIAHNSSLGYVHTLVSNGDGTYASYPNYGPGVLTGYTFYVADVNGDGKTDVVAHNSTDGYVHTLISKGDGTYNSYANYGPGVFSGYTFYTADVNGDDKSDIIAHNSVDGYVYTLISKGDGYYVSYHNYGPGVFAGFKFYPSNINGDGRTDIVAHDSTNGYVYTLISKGDATYVSYPNYGPGVFGGFTFYPADVTGDDRTDFVALEAVAGYVMTLKPNGLYADLLTSVSNGIGSATNIAYNPALAYTTLKVPFNVHTVSSVSVNDGNGNISTTNYTYSGGLYNYVNREFRGFQYSKSTDPAGSTAETWFNQDDIFKGLPYDQITKDSSGNIYTRVYNTYQSTSPYTGVNFPYLSRRDEYIYDGTASSKRAAISFTYDSYGNITRKYMYGDVDAIGDEVDEYTEYSYDTTKWILNRPSHNYVFDSGAVKRAEGWFTYDANGNLLTETKWLNGGTNPVVTYGYDAYGNQTSVTDPKGYTTTVAYDSAAYTYPVQTINHIGHTITAAYDQRFGKVTSQTDPNGNTTTYEYDVFGRPTKVINPNDGASTYGTVSYYYLNFGTVGSQKVVKYSTEQSGTANYIWDETYFDGLGRTINVRREGPDSKTIVQTVTYDQRGLKSAQSLPYFEGLETPRNITFTYDPAGRVTRTTNPDNTFVTTSYDKGRMTTIDSNDHKKVHEKDVYGRLVKGEEYSGTTGSYALYATTTYQYDALGNLTRTTDTLGNQTNISYDTLGRKTSMTDPDMGTWSYAYDANGNLTGQTDAKNQTIAFTYDALNRVTLKDYPTGTDVTYAYDEIAWSTNARGKLTTQTDATGTIKFYYDKLGAITKSTRTIDSVNYTIETTYDALGRTTSVKYPDNEVVSYTFDTAGNLSQVGTFATYLGYNALGQAGTVSYGNGVNTTYQYLSTNNRLSSIATSKQSQNLLNISYSYDNGGNILGINDLIDLNRSQGFTYDHLNRLTQAQSTSYGTLAYSYNQIGNMLSKEGVSYTYGGTKPHAVTATSDGKTYTYDANGNMTADTQRTISYDYDNMPSSVTFSGVTTNFVYDGSGTRVKKVTPGVTTLYISKIYECTNGSCGKYVFAGDTRVALKRGTEVFYYHQDHLNSSSIVTDATGTKVEEIYYYPFGGTRTDTGSISVNHKYTSQELDGETGLYYYGARYYNPQLGRFVSPDSIVTDGANPQDFNRYSYVLNNPLIYIDPSGHSWLSEAKDWFQGLLGDGNDVIDDVLPDNVNINGGGGGSIDSEGIEIWTGSPDTGSTYPIDTGSTYPIGRIEWNDIVGGNNSYGRAYGYLELTVGSVTVGGERYWYFGNGYAYNSESPYSWGSGPGSSGSGGGGSRGGTFISDGNVYNSQGILIGESGLDSEPLIDPLMFLGGGLKTAGKGAFATGKWLTHFEKHGAEFGYKNAVEYLRGAQRLTSGGLGILTHTRANGDKLFYGLKTNEFGVLAKDGQTIRTYFKPKEGIEYWLKQTGGR